MAQWIWPYSEALLELMLEEWSVLKPSLARCITQQSLYVPEVLVPLGRVTWRSTSQALDQREA